MSGADGLQVDPAAPQQQPQQRQRITNLNQMEYHEQYKYCRDEIPDFFGNNQLTSEAFIVKSEDAIESWHIHEGDQIRLVNNKLKGDAAKLQVDFRETNSEPTTFAEWKARFRSRFPVSTEETPAYLLLHKTAMQGGQLAKYIQDINRQVSRLGTGESGRMALIQELFLSNLNGNLRQVVEQSRPEAGWETLDQLQKATLRAQQTMHLQGTGQLAGSATNQPELRCCWQARPRG